MALRTERMRRIRALLSKEMFQVIRDPSSLLICVVLPILFIFLYGTGVSLDLNHLRIGLVLEDTAPDVQSLRESFTNSRYFEVTSAQDRRQLIPAIESGDIRGMVVIPSYFSAYKAQAEHIAPIQVIADGSETNTAHFVQNYAAGAVSQWLLQEQIQHHSSPYAPPLMTESRYWYNEELESKNFLLTGSLAITMTLIGTLLTSLVVAREWERGTMEGLMATPMGIYEFVVSKLIAYYVLGILSMVLSVAISLGIYRVPFRGSFIVLFIVSSVFLFSALGTGLLISTYSKNQIVASQASIVAGFLPSYMLSGFIFEISSMPLPIQWLTYLMPARYFVSCLESIFLVGNVWPLLIINIIPMIIIGTIIFILTSLKTVKRLD